MLRRPGVREYIWMDEEPLNGFDVRVSAIITGQDTPARGPAYDHGGLPPEYREVEITVERSFCPSTPDKCKGCEWEDLTDPLDHRPYLTPLQAKTWEDWLDRLREQACEREDEQIALAEEVIDEIIEEESIMDTIDPSWGED